MPEISIIIPVYKAEQYLSRCIESVLTQTYQDFELILIDDGSPDTCGEICDAYATKDERIHVIHQTNRGQAAARNVGLDWMFQNSDSRWLTFIDSDDWVHPQYLESLKKAVDKTGCMISIGRCEKTKLWHSMDPIEPVYTRISSTNVYTKLTEVEYNTPLGKLIRRDLFASIRFPEGRIWEDLATMYKVILPTDFCAIISSTLYYYFMNSDGTILSKWDPRKLDELQAYEEQIEYLSKKEAYHDVLMIVQKCYIQHIWYSYYQEQQSDLPKNDKQKYAIVLRTKMRNALKNHRRGTGIMLWKNPAIYEVAYPAIMRYYWFFHNRFRRGKNKND